MSSQPGRSRADRTVRPASRFAVDRTTAALIGLRVLILITVIVGVPDLRSSAANRFVEIANAPGVPYRDFPVEYPIAQLLVVELVGGWGMPAARVVLALVAFGADLTAWWALRRGWGGKVATRYLWLGAPLLTFIYRRVDLVVVALVAMGLASAERRRGTASGAWLGAGVLFRLWPAVLLPVLWLKRQITGAVSMVVVTASGLLAWAIVGGVGALGQVGSFRGAAGWELESTVGAVVWAITGQHRFEQGANRTGLVPGWARVLLLVVLVAGLTVVWWRATRSEHGPAGAPALAAVALLLGLSPLLSPQFVAWLLPMGAIASLDRRRWLWLVAAPLAITGGIVTAWYLHLGLGPGWNQALLTLRNATLLAIPVAWLALPGSTTRDELAGTVP